ncbi:MAG TPA: serine acetyltransferase [Spirochaetota bacterium]|jgi:serine O-acetyltransferase|nr:serine acetyltransferase [Spirochaetota bacterium]HOK93413.1 serine acetyltransferase [Spirochaetota bacterium]HON16218.1 serine acetyltransferase [Spirochaetota bacterium]HPD77380.1 serine acetyltransferase [Spirochaetota bacterium]HPP95947.1 serine acetyltransferase [Spirochaetota bacterium]
MEDNNKFFGKRFDDVVRKLADYETYSELFHISKHDIPMPSVDELREIMELIRSVIFPGYFRNSEINKDIVAYYTGAKIDRIYRGLCEQIKRGFCFCCPELVNGVCLDCEKKAQAITELFVEKLPEIRRLLSLDAKAAFEGDPAAHSIAETIFCYPSIMAMTYHRVAHELYKLDVPIIPRIISEMAHSRTGIDIHPGAEIGEYFFIDHGTGTVIGETCIIGKNVRIYQGVTLGAKSFPLDENGNPVKKIPRHPIIEDNVVIYSGATVLGRVTIGEGSEIGGNVWITESVPPHSKVVQGKAPVSIITNGN